MCLAKVLIPMDPCRWWHPVDRLLSYMSDKLCNDIFLEFFRTGKFNWGMGRLISKPFSAENKDAPTSLDYLGVNYYSNRVFQFHSDGLISLICRKLHMPVPFNRQKAYSCGALAGRNTTDKTDHAIYPEGLYRVLKRTAQALPNIPLCVTEFGIADKNDTKRNLFYKQHMYAIYKAIRDGVKVKGAHIWTWMDTNGWTPETIDTNKQSRYGLYAVNFDTQERTLREGAKDMVYLMHHNCYPKAISA